MKLLHTADLHLGQVLYQWYDRADEHEHLFAQLEALCREYRPDVLLMAGDIFDQQQPGAGVKMCFNGYVARLREVVPQIVIIAGNHDSASRLEADGVVWNLVGVSLLGQPPAAEPEGLAPGWEDRFIVQTPVGFVVAIPFAVSSRRQAAQMLLDRVAQRNPQGLPVVMAAHAAVQDCDTTGHDNIGGQRVWSQGEFGVGYDYLALGHIHRPQTLGQPIADEGQPLSRHQSPVARYSGSPLHVSCEEDFAHSISLVEVDHHGGTVSIQPLSVQPLRPFYILPPTDRPPLRNINEVRQTVADFCSAVGRGYFRLRLDFASAFPADIGQQIYSLIESTRGEVRFNPKHLWEGAPEGTSDSEERQPTFRMADLQQMSSPLQFVQRVAHLYPDLDIARLDDDFRLVEEEVLRLSESDAQKSTNRRKSAPATPANE